VVGQQQLKVNLPRFADSGGVGFYIHPVGGGENAGRLERPSAGVDKTEPAGAYLLNVFEVAERRYVNSRLPRGFQNSGAVGNADFYTVNRKGYIIHFFDCSFLSLRELYINFWRFC